MKTSMLSDTFCIGKKPIHRICLLMKLSVVLLLTTCLHASANGLGQKVTISTRNAPITKVFKEIEKQTGYSFVYAKQQLANAKSVTVSVVNEDLDIVLQELFEGMPLTYTLSGKYIAIKERVMVEKTKVAEVAPPIPFTITGTITDPEGKPMEGVSVLVKSTNMGVTTNKDGVFSIQVPEEGDVLLFSFVGFETKEIKVTEATVLNIGLKIQEVNVEEVVVVGYGTQRKRDVTGAVSTIPKDRLTQLPNTNVAQALQGSVPGLQITTNGGGAEGNDLSILIRGRNSISAGNSPLIIWDGIPYEGGISEINPNDVESIEVLRDASATAIYGSRGSNGVIIITSKQGKKGKLNITYDGFYGTQTITNRPDLLSGDEFYNFKTTRLNAPNIISAEEKAIYEAGTSVDWYDLATQQGARSQHSLAVAGGTEKTSFYLGGTYLDVKGVAINDRFKRYSLRPNLEIKVTPWLTINSSTQFSFQDRSGLPVEFSDTRNTGGGANFFNPLTNPFNPDGTPAIYAYADYPPARNPLSNTIVQNIDNSYRIFSANSLKIDFPFLKGLSYKLNTGVEYENNQRKTYWGRDVALGFESNGYATNYNSIGRNFTVENILNYSKEFGRHNVNVTGLYSSQSNDFDRDQLEGQGFPNDVLTNYQMSAATLLTPSSTNFKQNLLSQMGRLNYGYDGKYLLTLTVRRDGYSGFGANNKYGTFPSAAVAWNLHREAFMENISTISNLKLRASYGANGNQAVSAYSSLAKLANFPYVTGTTVLPGYIPSSLANEELGWETTKSFSVGLDFGLWNNRVQGSIDYYTANTSDLLLNRIISSVQGFTRILQNIGKTSNQGIEVGITSTNIKSRDFTWTSNLNFSRNVNKIVDLYGDGKDDVANSWFIGKPIRVIYGLQDDGVFKSQKEVDESAQKTAKPGWVRVKDINGDSIINTASDRTIIGNQDPKFIWGFTNTFNYKRFSLMVFIHGVNGVTKRNPFEDDNVFTDVRRNTTRKDWWSPTNPNGNHFANDANANPLGVNFYEDATFMRLKDISLAYELPASLMNKIKLNSCKFYITGRNLATFTGYGGLDPELNDQFGLPLQKEVIFGLTISL
jgi:TonB-linked SusC/RagA family outer membrane protein